MKQIVNIQASHVNTGTALPRDREIKLGKGKRVLRNGKLHAELSDEPASACGGLALAAGVVRRIGLASALDSKLNLLKIHRPYRESDHVLTHAYNLFVGGNAIEDIASLQGCPTARAILGADAVPDPTTAGDFLRRFDKDSLVHLDDAIDAGQAKVWQARWKNKKQPLAMIDLDSHLSQVYGDKKEGADFCRKGYLAYHPLVISLAGTGECLRLINRPGNVSDREDAHLHLKPVLDLVGSRFKRVIVRGDSKFAAQNLYDVIEEYGHEFAFVSPHHPNLSAISDALPASAWKDFQPKPHHEPCVPEKQRTKRASQRSKSVEKHDKRNLQLKKQWVAEFDYEPKRSSVTYRMIVRKQLISERHVGGELFDLYRYRFVITNIRDESATEVLHHTYQRCDQEKVIEQLQNGIAAMRMPTGNAIANAAFLTISRIGHCLKSWIAQLAGLGEVVRWSWKRFRYHFVYVPVRVIRSGRRAIVRIFKTNHSSDRLLEAMQRL